LRFSKLSRVSLPEPPVAWESVVARLAVTPAVA